MPRPQIVLPQFYYHDHFVEMTGFVTSVYGAMLGDAERTFIADFGRLDQWAQCLYIRMSNRKRAVFCLDDLRYEEIGDIWSALDQLRESGFIRHADERDYRDCLGDLAKPDLTDLACDHGVTIKSGWAKGRLVEVLHAAIPYDAFAANKNNNRFVPRHRDIVGFLLYLYFGKLNDNLTSFALRDMGVVSVRSQDSYQARFDDIAEARAGYFYHRVLKTLKAGSDALALVNQVDDFPSADTDFTVRLRDQVLHALGQACERQKQTARAIALYERSTSFDSHERVVRLLHSTGQMERVQAMLDRMMANPDHDEEYIFASDFHARKFGGQRTGVFTELLRNSETIHADELYRGHAEHAAIRHFEGQGLTAHHTENGLWPALFGLIFWHELFEAPGALSSGFDWMPKALKDGTFHVRFADEIAAKLAAIRDGRALELVKQTFRHYQGKANGLFTWFEGLPLLMWQFLDAAPADAVAVIVEKLTQDFRGMRDGFPDLLVVRDEGVKFIEVKGEGDQIRRNQLARLNLLRTAGFDVGICRIAYRVDPDQVYVVVDVETTGGRPPNDRVTEIGAVKIQHGRVIDEWQSLINPQKRIPQFITQLTGITNAMVADAPTFAEIADDFAAFMGNAIFVAHNVNFDHGFIASEYRRLERRFHYPKLCTVASMRRYYPGLAAYGLGPLSRHFDINLTDHHRALADARAAAELLNMVNSRRLPDETVRKTG